jgi:hypothetical protein
VKTSPSRTAATEEGEPDTVKTPFAIVLPSLAAFGSERVPLPAALDVTVAVSVCPALASLIVIPENGLTLAVFVVATFWVAGVIAIGTATAVAVMTDVATAVLPEVSSISAVTVVVTAPPGATWCGVGVNTRPSSAAATDAKDPETSHTPASTVLPSVAALGSESVPLAAVLKVTLAVSVWPA